MALGIARILTVLSILQYTLRVNDRPDLSTQALLRQREAELTEQRQQMMWLQQQVEQEQERLEQERLEQERQEPRGLPQVLLLALWQHCDLCYATEALLTLLGLLRLLRKWRAAAGSGSQQRSFGTAEQTRGQRGGTARQGRAQADAASSAPSGRRLRGGRGRR